MESARRLTRKFRLSKEIAKIVTKHRTFSPAKIRDIILHEYNVDITPEAITMFFKRHPKVLAELQSTIEVKDAETETISYEVDYWVDGPSNLPKTQRSTKSQIPIIQQWIDVMILRKVNPMVRRKRIMILKNICEGLKQHLFKDENGKLRRQFKKIIDWHIHPLAIDEKKAQEYLVELNKRNMRDHEARLILRNFLKYAKGIEPTSISGEKGESYGAMAKEYFNDEERDRIFYVLDHTFKLGIVPNIETQKTLKACVQFLEDSMTRASATLKVGKRNFEKMNIEGKEILFYTVIDKGRVGKKKRSSLIVPELKQVLEDYGLERERLFPFTPAQLRDYLKQVYTHAGITREIKQPIHNWRHTGAMKWLRRTGFNYTFVQHLGRWKSDQVLKDCYGSPELQDLIPFAYGGLGHNRTSERDNHTFHP